MRHSVGSLPIAMIPNNLRFSKAIDDTRPYHTHRYDVFAPKIQRPVTIFGQGQLKLWTLLESDPLVEAYCERPVVLVDKNPKRVIDFWARRRSTDELWIVTNGQSENNSVPNAFLAWADLKRFEIRKISFLELERRDMFLQNWGLILRDLGAFARLVDKELMRKILALRSFPMKFIEVQNRFAEFDPVITRVCVFSLIHCGRLLAPDIESKALGPESEVVKA